MKKRILLFTTVMGMAYLSLTSYDDGPAAHNYNRTGAKNSATNCSAGGCHGTGTSTSVTIEVDSAATAVTRYMPGQLYTIKIHGASSTLQPKFGFQFVSVKGAGTAQTQAGTASALPAGVASHAYSSLNFIEHNTTLTAATAGVYDVSFQWTAPAAGTGNVTLYCTLNAVDGGGSTSPADISGNISVTLTELPTTSVPVVTNNINISAYPNPATTNLNVQVSNAQTGNYSLQVFDMSGRMISNENIAVSSANYITSVNTGNWPAGMYHVVLQKDGVNKTISVVKQ